MPLSAVYEKTGDRVVATDYENLRDEFSFGELLCPFCNEQMIIVQGLLKRPHFRHRVACSTELIYHPESQPHLQGKSLVRHWINQRDDYRNSKIELEVAVPEAGRIADVMVTFEKGWREAHEIQLASITAGNIDERTDSYNKAGVEVVWWLGETSCGADVKRWFLDKYGYLLEVFIDTKSYTKTGFLER